MVEGQTPQQEKETVGQKLSRQEAAHYGSAEHQQLEAGYQKLESALSTKQLSAGEFQDCDEDKDMS